MRSSSRMNFAVHLGSVVELRAVKLSPRTGSERSNNYSGLSEMFERKSNSPPLPEVEPFIFKDTRGYNRVLTAGRPPPSKITEYIVSPADWSRYALPETRTVDDVLRRGLDAVAPCGMCGSGGEDCESNDCINEFRRQVSAYGESITEIRTVPDKMGKGIFATCNIPAKVWIGEYLGKLVPPQLKSEMEDNMYLFEFDSTVTCDASLFGNWTRFMNHHCRPNVDAMELGYARRKVIGFRTARRIRKGEQLSIWYGEDYFRGNSLLCRCNAQEGDHMPQDSPSSSANVETYKTTAPESAGKVIGERTRSKRKAVKSTSRSRPHSSKVTKSSGLPHRKRSSRKRMADDLSLRSS